ncbi:MAG TPA: site-2 protease family protein [Gaiellaceae bacterium]|nr:site-2 protease family protein [Gaiellaceae bacterium]
MSFGRIFGIEIGVNWSWLVAVALIVWTLAVAIFPETNPGFSDGTYIAMAVSAAVLFFAALLLHELGHALQARREGMQIEGITLWLFGGVARFSGSFPSAGTEFRVAAAGPLVSLVLGLAATGVAWAISSPEPVDAVAAWLGYINLTLLAFNLLPAVPLDGGRILHAALWQASGDSAKATRQGTRVSRVFAFLFVGLGVFLVINGNVFSGVWMAFIGWFLLQAATAEDRYALVGETLGGLRVRDLMVRDPVTVTPGMTLGQFMDEVAWSRRYTTYPVVDDGRPVGLLAFRGVTQVPRWDWDRRTVGDCMIPLDRVPQLEEDEPAVDALAELSEEGVHRGLVLDDGRLAGLLSITDLARALEVRAPRRAAAAGS